MSGRVDSRVTREIQSVVNYLKGQSFHFSLEWVTECVEFYLTEHRIVDTAELHAFVKAQWLLSDLQVFGSSSLPENLKSLGRVTLPGKYVLQMQTIIDISVSCYTQYQKLKKVDQTNIDVREEPTTFQLPKSNRMFMMELTDGIQTINAIEEEPIRALLPDMVPGIKVLIIGPVRCAKGRLRLIERNIHVLGGEVESLLVKNAPENIFARALGFPENPDPYNLHPPEIKQDVNLTAVNNTVNDIEQWDEDGLLDDEFEAQLLAVEGDTFVTHNRNMQPNIHNIPHQQVNIIPPQRSNINNIPEQRYHRNLPGNIVNNSNVEVRRTPDYEPNNHQVPFKNSQEPIIISDDEDNVDYEFLQSIDELEMKATTNRMVPPSRQTAANWIAHSSNAPQATVKTSTNQVTLQGTTNNAKHPLRHPSTNELGSHIIWQASAPKTVLQSLQTISNQNAQTESFAVNKTPQPAQGATKVTGKAGDPQTSNLDGRRKNTKQTTLQFQKLDVTSLAPKLSPKQPPLAVNKLSEDVNKSTEFHQDQKQKSIKHRNEHGLSSMHANESLPADAKMELEPKCEPYYFETNSVRSPEPVRPVAPIMMLNSKPWVYLKQLKDLHVTTRSQFYTVNASIMKSITKVDLVGTNAYHFEVLISDGTANLQVAFSSDVLEKFLGYSPAEVDEMISGVNTNPLTMETLQKAFSRARQTIIALDCLMSIEFNSAFNLPVIVEVFDLNEQHCAALRKRSDSCFKMETDV